ncbi:MAG: polymerase PolC, partial [Paenibacillaceae bacterium]|nr:polymerase PolC [Paenibacillaceae bacterium]
MNELADKRNRFEILLKQAEVPGEIMEPHFAKGYIDKVEVVRETRDWTLYITVPDIVPHPIYRSFCQQIREKLEHIATIRIVMHFSSETTLDRLVNEYWGLLIEWVQQEVVSVNGWMSKAEVTVQGNQIIVTMLDQVGLELATKKKIDHYIKTYFSRFFGVDCQVKLQVGESSNEVYERFAEEIRVEELAVAREMMIQAKQETSASAAAPADSTLMAGYPIKEEPIPLQDVKDEEKRVVVQGAVFGLDVKELRNGSTLYTFNVTDFSDSLGVKIFAKTKEDVRTYSLLANGKWLRLRGKVEYDRFSQQPELMMIPNDINEVEAPPERMDDAEEKRVEFHLHSSMSAMDGITPVDQYIKTAAKWGHKALAITDHGVVQSFPEADHAAHKYGIKIIYGMEANVVDDAVPIVMNGREMDLASATYVIFDIETTGLSVINNKIIEIAGVKMKEGAVVDSYSSFVNPHEKIPYHITQLTNITDEMVSGARDLSAVMPEFFAFVGDSVLVAHNARFDMGFIQEHGKRLGLPKLTNPVLDTLEMARFLYPTMKNHRLNTLADKFKVSLENHHRAVDDAEALGNVLFHLIKGATEREIADLDRLSQYAGSDLRNQRPFHCCIYALNAVGKKNLYQLVSMSHTQYYNRVPCIPKSKLSEFREGLLIVSGCEKGEFFEAVLNKSVEEAEQVAEYYDVLEIQPLDMNMHLVEKGLVGSRQELEQANRRVWEIGMKLGKPVIATGNVHYLHPRDKICRDITINGITGFSPLKEQRKPDAHLRTTKEMLQEFHYLGEKTAHKVVIANPNELADRFEEIELFPRKAFFPVIDQADEEMRDTCYATARRVYGDPVPEIVVTRLEKELKLITRAGFAPLFLIAQRLVKKSNEDGYLVGSRGSVGSSVVAMMLGVSEVNPLQPHYLCRSCQHSEWFTDGSVASGFDLADKPCPKCGTIMKGDGQDIPIETFIGFKGDKVPDIDLNFSGDYQPKAHNYTKVLFGEKNVFRAGTIGTIAEKTAFGYVKKYEEEKAKSWRGAEVSRLAEGCTGVKRNTGQHPGGIVVVPEYIDVEDITPVQFPADDTSSEWKTTHFDYHAFDANLLKLDILGHDDPTMMRMLQELTGVDPTTIDMNDPKVMTLFNSTEGIGVTPEQIRTKVAVYGLPDMGTKFIRQMLEETRPSSFSDLLQISGLSHGNGLWLGNAQDLIRKNICTIKTVIGCRDNIMLYLIYRGMEEGLAFTITESVRKGKGLTDEWIAAMRKHDVPEWYIDSCNKIVYMFPRAHAAAYVTSAVRCGWFKVYHPIEFYATYFTVRAADFEIELFAQGYDAILRKQIEIEEKGFQAQPKEKAMLPVLEMGLEMTARGFTFKTLDLYRSDATRFLVDGDSLIPP